MTSTARKLLSALDERKAADICTEILDQAGVVIGTDLFVHDDRLWPRVLREGSLGFGEAYMDGWWDAPSIDGLINKVTLAHLDRQVRDNWVLIAHAVRARLFNPQLARPFEVAQRHYDIGNDLYEAMLDKRMAYTCGYWREAKDLDAAQEAKLELICKKLALRPGMRVLELGCGWGSFASYAAERFGVSVVAYNVSKEQVAWIQSHYGHLPIDVRLEDYRNASGQFDAVVSIGLMEHVGIKNYRAYMEQVDRCLAPGGVGFVHTIASNRYNPHGDPWFDRYIFPHYVFPSLGRLAEAMEGLLVLEDVHNIGEHYDPTLMAWWQRFDAAWPTLREKYGDRFYRMWKYYLLASAGTFRARHHQLLQLVFTRDGTRQPKGLRAS